VSKSNPKSADATNEAPPVVAEAPAPITTKETAQALVDAFAPLAPATEPKSVPMTPGSTLAEAVTEAATAPLVVTVTDVDAVAKLDTFLDGFTSGEHGWTYVGFNAGNCEFYRKGDDSTITLTAPVAARAMVETAAHLAWGVQHWGGTEFCYSVARRTFAKAGYALPKRSDAIAGSADVVTTAGITRGKNKGVTQPMPVVDNSVPTLVKRLTEAKQAVASLTAMLDGVIASSREAVIVKTAALTAAQGDVTAIETALQAPLTAGLKVAFVTALTAAQLQVNVAEGEKVAAIAAVDALEEAGLLVKAPMTPEEQAIALDASKVFAGVNVTA